MGEVVELFPAIPDIELEFMEEELFLNVDELVAFVDGEIPVEMMNPTHLRAITSLFLTCCAEGIFSDGEGW